MSGRSILCYISSGMEQQIRDSVEYLRRRQDELQKRYGIRTIRVFGSRVRGDYSVDSDIDILITAERPYRFDLLGLIDLEQKISDDLGMPVDLIIEEDLKPSIAKSALADSILV